MTADTKPLLEVDHLVVEYGRGKARLRAVDDVSIIVRKGQAVGLVGESGCGKSSLGRAALQLENVYSGSIAFDGERVDSMSGQRLQRFRGRAQMVFQDPVGSLNPRLSVGQVLHEVLSVHDAATREKRESGITELMTRVGLDPQLTSRFPHELSGGQRQRVGIARALAVGPELLICDEPVSALDVSVQVQILNLLRTLRCELGLSYLFIAHDLAVVRYLCETVYVMYRGRIVESGDAETVFSRPMHPYTRLLVHSVPDIERGLQNRGQDVEDVMKDDVVQNPAQGCDFRTRCPLSRDRCHAEIPLLRPVASERMSACHFAEEVPRGLDRSRTST